MVTASGGLGGDTEIKAFEIQLDWTKDSPEYVFYDCPPFATGLPHYDHIPAGTIKDIVTWYQSMNDFHVTRRFGWDCHGLLVENEIDRRLNLKKRDDVLKLGILVPDPIHDRREGDLALNPGVASKKHNKKDQDIKVL
ncbi:isoleucine--trna ligase [Quercus suber]|uniref:Isoleucine--trna ligase n=1 Tax=Quercus suber TaxID=58331 RepID=A0AAW0JVN1_QUESU